MPDKIISSKTTSSGAISDPAGVLFVVATPIGNLEDITLRAITTLKNCDLIAAEDSRHSKKLLNHLGIHTPMVAYHDHNERNRAQQLINQCKQGLHLALISDAGTPLISDPGYILVKLALSQGIRVETVPGACAAIAALSIAGLPSDRFSFEGFLPAKKSAREAKLSALEAETRTMIFYESTHRIGSCMQSMASCFGANRSATLAKELTKSHETIIHNTCSAIIEWLESDEKRLKGEFVILVEGATARASAKALPEDEVLMKRLLQDLSIKQAAHLAADLTGKRKKHFYTLGISLEQPI